MKLAAPLSAILLLAAIAPAQTPPLDFKNPQAIAALQKDLASDDFATRERAQRLLDQVPLAARDDLAKLAAAATDPEAQARLRARVDLLDDIRVTDPPPISLHVKDATLEQVAKALAKATALDIAFTPPAAPAGPPELYTLQADNLPFWEIHRQLSAQHPLWYSVGVNDIRAYRDANNTWRDTVITRGTAVFLQDLKAPRPGIGATNRYTTTLGLGIDPRICILQLKQPEFPTLTDNAGARWTAAPSSTFTTTVQLGRAITFTRAITLEPSAPAAPVGKNLPSLRGHFPILVRSAIASKSLDPAKDLNQPFTLGNVEITVTHCSASNDKPPLTNSIQFDLAVHVAPEKDADPAPYPIGPITVNILDATGNIVVVRTLPQGFIGTMTNSFAVPATPPISFRLDVTTAVREVKIPFDFKNVPIP